MTNRLYHIDLLRFIAALYVVIFHYAFRGHIRDSLSLIGFAPLEEFAKYGYLGVDLFFIISGFVILMSARNSNIIDFCISRFSRLYPAYWIGVIITTIVIVLWGGERYSVSSFQVLANLTMLSGFFDVKHVDGVYWSLLIELKFYIVIGIILIFGKIRHIRKFAFILLFFAALQILLPFGKANFILKIIYFFTFPEWSSYFIAGMFFFLIKSEKNIKENIFPLLSCYVISLIYAYHTTMHKIDYYGVEFSVAIIFSLITGFYLFMFLVSIEKLPFLNKRIFLTLGVLTYPLYLIHQFFGYIILNNLGKYVNKWVLLILVITLMLFMSYLINKYLEKPMGSYIRNSLKNNRVLNNIKYNFKGQ